VARLVAHLASQHPGFANAHRVLASDGRVAGEEAGAGRRRARLIGEGVAFHGRVADPARRVGWVELRGRLHEAEM
jgi:alkylated DNA nucleotide flippase Atl1